MAFPQQELTDADWSTLEITDSDLENLYNHLLELEEPQTTAQLTDILIQKRMQEEVTKFKRIQTGKGKIYFPKDRFLPGEQLQFPAFNWQSGQVTSVRAADNPDSPPFEVVTVEFGQNSREMAAGLEEHGLNSKSFINPNDPTLSQKAISVATKESIGAKLQEKFSTLPDLVQIAGFWFPRSLLVDVNLGYLNLAEAVLEVASGGPLNTRAILDQIELPTDVNIKLTEFSMNLALQEDPRFDEVGPSGEILWFLNRLEPKEVQNPPVQLRYQPTEMDLSKAEDSLRELNKLVYDEMEPFGDLPSKENEIAVSLIYPHWAAGTIPLSQSISRLFPSAYEAPRVRFTFIDADTGKAFPGWVVRPYRYVYGLKDWYQEMNLIPGALFLIKRGNKPGEVIIQAFKKRVFKEWIRTILVGTDGGFVFTMLKQQISNDYDDRMVTAIPDREAVEKLWENQSRNRTSLDKVVLTVFRELMKLSPQGHVHAQELYAAVNVVRRCPPSCILGILHNHPQISPLGNLYYRLNDQTAEV